MFQRFEIHSRIVKRSGITFYGARDKLLGREVWLWRLIEFEHLGASPESGQLNAWKAPLRALKHPGIVPLHDIEADPDGVVALMEPAAGETLDEWMTHRAVDVRDFNQIAASCLQALSAAAAAGVPHGALEPGLIFTSSTEDGRMNTSVLGFGIARLMAQLQGIDIETSEALDVWVLGGILHALLTGEPIEEGQLILPPHEVRPEIPVPLSEWVMRLLAEDANARPQTAAGALELLQQALTPVEQAPANDHPHMQLAQWPAGYDPNLHPQAWHYPQVPVWNMPPVQWTQPYDPALAAQQPQMWQQMPYYPWPGQMPHDPQHQHPAQQHFAPTAAAAPQVAAQNSNAPKPRLPAPPKSARTTDEKPAATSAKQKTSLKKWIGPAISLAAAAVVVWFFRDVFSPVFRRETWQGMFGDKVTIKWPGDDPPVATPPPKDQTAPPPVVAAKPVEEKSPPKKAPAKTTKSRKKSPGKKNEPAKSAGTK